MNQLESANKVIHMKQPEWLEYTKSGKAEIQHVLLGREIYKELELYKNNTQYAYFDKKDGVWKEYTKQYLRSYIVKKLGIHSTQKVVNETLSYIEDEFHIHNQDNPFEESDPYLIAIKNGTLNLKTKKFKATFDPKDFIQTKHPDLKYNPEANCPTIEKFFISLAGEEHLDFLYEWFGFQLVRTYIPQAFLFLTGTGGTGKSTLLELLKTFVGKHNVVANSLDTLTNSNFALGDLYAKSANICGDIEPKYMNNPGLFKSITGNDVVTADRKYLKALSFKNYAKISFSMNSLPPLSDFTDGMKRRALILPISRKIPKSEINPDLMKEMSTEEELSGLLNKAIEGVQRLLTNKWFTTTPTIQREIDNWFEESDIVQQFINEKCISDKDNEKLFIRAEDLFFKFDRFRGDSRAKEMTRTTFNKRMINLGYIKKKKNFTNGPSYQAFFGIRPINEEREW